MSDNARPDLRAFRELEALVRNVSEELATFRRRALLAESRVKDPGPGGKRHGAVNEQLAALESENAALRSRLDRAEQRVQQMVERLRFLRQQLQAQTAGAGASRS